MATLSLIRNSRKEMVLTRNDRALPLEWNLDNFTVAAETEIARMHLILLFLAGGRHH